MNWQDPGVRGQTQKEDEGEELVVINSCWAGQGRM
jgi:hypothetical protein